MNPFFDPAQPHHRANGFQNRYGDFEPKSLRDVLRWRRAASRQGLPRPPRTLPPTVPPDLAFLRANAAAGAAMQPAATFIGHATVLVQLPSGAGGITLITDPVFSERASPLPFIGPKRLQPPGVALADLPHIDLVLISHNHYDHLDLRSVRALASQAGGAPLFVVPLGLAAWFATHGIPGAVELDWFKSHRLQPHGAAPIDITLTPSQHWSGRGLHDRLATLWGGFAVLSPDFHFYFAGDTGYSPDFADIASFFAAQQTPQAGGGFDLALLPVGAYEPRWFMRTQHVDPAEAVRIHRDIGAKRSIGIHWGTFALTDESFDEPPQALAAACRAVDVAESEFSVMAIGATRCLPRRLPPSISPTPP